MRWRTEHSLLVALLIALALPGLTAWAAYHAAGDLRGARVWIGHSRTVVSHLQHLELQMSTAGSEQRAYLLQAAPNHLDAYHAALDQVAGDLGQVKTLVADDPAQESNLAVLAAAARARQSSMDHALELRRAGRNAAAIQAADSPESLSSAQQVRMYADRMQEVERNLLSARSRTAAEFQTRWMRFFWAACIASISTLLACFVVLVLEVRRRRRTETALGQKNYELQQSYARYNHLIDNIPSTVWAAHQDGELEFLSARIRDLTGFSPEEVRFQGVDFWSQRVYPEDLAAVKAACAALFHQEQPLLVEFRLRHADNSWIWVQAHSERAVGPPGARVAEGVLVDITLRKRFEAAERQRREIEVQNREMAHANRVKSEFLASVSHELRTPLSAILGFTELMQQRIGGPLSPEQAGFIAHIHNAGGHLLHLVTDILDLARLEAGQMQFTPERLNLGRAAHEAMETVEQPAAQKSIALECRIDPELEVWGDPLRVRQILINLLSNAVKFTPPNGAVAISAECDESEARICVSDTGIGIAPEHLNVIFERFHQVGNATNGLKEGTGLGLAITQQLVTMHRGAIRAESEPGRGSRFIFTLPLQPSRGAVHGVPPHAGGVSQVA